MWELWMIVCLRLTMFSMLMMLIGFIGFMGGIVWGMFSW